MKCIRCVTLFEADIAQVHVDSIWQGSGIDELGIDTKSVRMLIRNDQRYCRPTDVDLLIGDL